VNKRIELNKTLLIVNEMLKLKDRNSVDGITILNSDYFDIPSNSYSTRGLNSALDRAQAECERLFNILKTT